MKEQLIAHIVDLRKYTDQQQQLARIAKALGHPARIATIIGLLEKQSHCYQGDLTADLPITASSVFQHLNAPTRSGGIQPAESEILHQPGKVAGSQTSVWGIFFQGEHAQSEGGPVLQCHSARGKKWCDMLRARYFC